MIGIEIVGWETDRTVEFAPEQTAVLSGECAACVWALQAGMKTRVLGIRTANDCAS